ncbi:hypothetical protein TTHERM_000474539 (macronuclear) [Tetrahymena thermophila SB210]|uniref:Uncharacterized protein n=1 Tax=Tetrahymena thermophila (strain SB210) TaxID=312017 RepID=W7XDV1_TETTS|nr:hypothetical protein TTHERM_000474539 [Tetrahymena thermophila SB210]EWS72046.1 hypothetical protein TTHERM_000474539 [Tetrahymena thermophila SB210]|eukprot:XP_012655421.1 hypothetical protein TTHERM_000474539 [Tetrahymena thermophila SB210]
MIQLQMIYRNIQDQQQVSFLNYKNSHQILEDAQKQMMNSQKNMPSQQKKLFHQRIFRCIFPIQKLISLISQKIQAKFKTQNLYLSHTILVQQMLNKAFQKIQIFLMQKLNLQVFIFKEVIFKQVRIKMNTFL